MPDKVDNLFAKTIKTQADTQRAIECFNPELLGTRSMQSHAQIPQHIPQTRRLEWERYIVMPSPSTTSGRVAWWESKRKYIPRLASIAAFLVRRPRSACHVERVFRRILTPDRRNMSDDTLRHLAMMYINKDACLDNEQ